MIRELWGFAREVRQEVLPLAWKELRKQSIIVPTLFFCAGMIGAIYVVSIVFPPDWHEMLSMISMMCVGWLSSRIHNTLTLWEAKAQD